MSSSSEATQNVPLAVAEIVGKFSHQLGIDQDQEKMLAFIDKLTRTMVSAVLLHPLPKK